MSVLWWIGGLAYAFECAEPVQHEEVEEALTRSEAAYAEFDDIGFRDRVNELSGVLLPCVADALPRPLVARTHEVIALQLLSAGDAPGASLAMIAARRADPEAQLATAMFPEGHPLRDAWATAELEAQTRKVPEPRIGTIAFDGERSRRRPDGVPTIAQLFDETGLARTTTYLAAREPLPGYDAIPRRRNTLIACSAGAVVTSGVLYGWGWSQRSKLVSLAADPSAPAGSLDAARSSVNVLSALSAGVFGAAAGCGVGAAVIGPR